MTRIAKKVVAALAIAVMATMGTVGAAGPADAAVKTSRIGGGWCC